MHMLDLVQAVSGGLYLVTMTVLGMRLLVLALRNHQRPELMLSLAFLLGGSVGATLEVVAAQQLPSLGGAQAGQLLALGKLVSGTGLGIYNVFVWRVFRPGADWAGLLCIGLIGLTGMAWVGMYAAGSFRTGVVTPGWFAVELLARAASPIWLAAESGRYWVQMRRRVAVGLGDALVANRFLLWSIGAVCGLVMLLTSVPPIYLRADHPFLPFDITVLGIAGIAASLPYWLAFFPPTWYRRRFAAA